MFQLIPLEYLPTLLLLLIIWFAMGFVIGDTVHARMMRKRLYKLEWKDLMIMWKEIRKGGR